ncbi:hypothetical protein [Photobacterium lutimaris]|uniref:Uncharacterized protein n=1 Tax=Photobacterium lutimaris TaxID=388278 RepID=A0A2T3J1P0_9GAMM|nr:hypothetical protein [Photobacterium lutimaris]PSU34996.1 hypothetical protein C9I99_07975 [Photobacterium lutimaris]TDR77352.1 hypothetical protein DFP78_102369 [Photobacterium lutimaris]
MNTALIFLIPALLGAQLVLTLVLTKGDICPGQRGRVHKTLPVLLLGWLVVALYQPYAFLPLAALGYFTLKVKTGKTRDAGPLNVFYVANVVAFFVWFSMLLTLTLPVAAMSLVSVVLFGSLLAHLLLTQARTRLQAFHRLLPFAGFVSAMVSVLCLLWLANQFDESQLALLTTNIVASLVLLVAGLLVWSMHLLTGKTVNRWQLVIAAGILVLSANMQVALI